MARKLAKNRPSELAKKLRGLKPLVSYPAYGHARVMTSISLSASERALLDEAARVHNISRAAVLRAGLPLAVAQLLTATTALGAKEDR